MKTSAARKPLALQTLVSVSEAIRRREVSPVEVVTTCLDRIERLQPQLNAFITIVADAALQAAHAAAREIDQGRSKGPLHGIPVAIKDFYDTAGIRTTAAFERFRERIPTKNAVSVEKLIGAGAIVVGKTNMHTLGMGTTGLESHFGPVKNPWNAEYVPGGSSSGSAVAVASGLCYATLDTDAIGSCRLPAACCGVVGFKGSYGAIDISGILGGEQPPDDTIRWLSHAGLTTRGIEDTVVLLEVLAEQNATAPGPRETLSVATPLRIGIANNFHADTEITEAFGRAIATIKVLGHAVSSVEAPFTDSTKGTATIQADRQDVGRRVFSDIDVLVVPTTATTTPAVKDADKNPLALSPELTMFANYYGLPAVSVPCGFDSRRLPVGLQIVANRGNDGAALRFL